jgi:hypothetical protein
VITSKNVGWDIHTKFDSKRLERFLFGHKIFEEAYIKWISWKRCVRIWIILDKDHWRALENAIMILRVPQKARKYLAYLSDYYLPNGCAP